jgi:hypothetical protein
VGHSLSREKKCRFILRHAAPPTEAMVYVVILICNITSSGKLSTHKGGGGSTIENGKFFTGERKTWHQKDAQRYQRHNDNRKADGSW